MVMAAVTVVWSLNLVDFVRLFETSLTKFSSNFLLQSLPLNLPAVFQRFRTWPGIIMLLVRVLLLDVSR